MVEAVAAARQAIGDDAALMLDVNCPWTPAQALAMGRRFEPYGLAWFEEPVWPPENLQALSDLHGKLGLPIAAGENCANAWSFRSLVATEGLDILQPSITKVGGVSEFIQVATMAQLHGRQLVPHSPYFGPGYLATLQMAAVFPATPWFEYLSVTLERPIFGEVGCVSSEGSIAIPNAPGLGADPDPEILQRYRVA
jgi:D-galactarolactone cycloisomerase